MRPLPVLAWALYDLANQFFALNVVSLYFVRWLVVEKQVPEILYSIAFGISTLLVGVLSPVLGAVSDITERRRPFLVSLTLLSVAFTVLLGFTDRVPVSLLCFAVANFGCQAAIIFYNAQMVAIAPAGKIGFVSGLGRMFGYSGAILALYLMKPQVLKGGYQATFVPTGLLFLLFALPCMLLIKDKNPRYDIPLGSFLTLPKLSQVLGSLRSTLSGSLKSPELSNFAKSSFFGLCAVNVVLLFMSIYGTVVFKLDEARLVNLIAVATVFAMAGSFFSGMLSDYLGYKRSLCGVFMLWCLCFWFGAFAKSSGMYWVIGALAGAALGSVWVVSRAMVVRLVPGEKAGEMFGVFNLISYFSAVSGALFWGISLYALSFLGELRYRVILLSLILFMILAFVFILRIPERVLRKK